MGKRIIPPKGMKQSKSAGIVFRICRNKDAYISSTGTRIVDLKGRERKMNDNPRLRHKQPV